MLILTRKLNETLCIYPNDCDEDPAKVTTITILGIAFNTAKLGISAPSDLTIHREEILRKIRNKKSDYIANYFEGVVL